jgi:hypothetical protein
VNEKTEGIYAYPSSVKIFDEYMTFGVFLLYCRDNYDKALYEETRRGVIGLMAERGLPKMETFVSSLEKASASAPDKKIDELYPKLLEMLGK